MAMTVNPLTPSVSGAALTKSYSGGTQASALITATTAQSSLDLSKLAIIIENASTTASVAVTLSAGDNYSEIGQGSQAITVATSGTVVIGGKDFESARFLDSADKVELTFATASTIYVSAIQIPGVAWNPS